MLDVTPALQHNNIRIDIFSFLSLFYHIDIKKEFILTFLKKLLTVEWLDSLC